MINKRIIYAIISTLVFLAYVYFFGRLLLENFRLEYLVMYLWVTFCLGYIAVEYIRDI